jgi:hypothetical protein
VRNWDYYPDRARTQMCRLIVILDLCLNFAESPVFEEYIRLSHNPVFKKVSRQTTSRDFVKFFTDRRTKVVECLQSVTSIAITSSIGVVMLRRTILVWLLIMFLRTGY